ncbi:hypothetical protein AAG570_007908 [Ranatra chinensis]|uniref:ADAMTS/ADAMTS-like Spacer 1 domain-containing protein n=1 Tax=Ranatra chinensis TaxID=642074 RepID=A0ABD0XT68_9HEMI
MASKRRNMFYKNKKQETTESVPLRKKDGSYIINGNWAINLSGEYTGAGTKFYYQRDDSRNSEGEYISSPGPLAEPVDLMIIYQQPNPGIKYQYRIPLSVEAIPSSSVMRHPQSIQTAIMVCIRESNEVVVPDKRCSSIEKHSLQPKRCNIKPCIAELVALIEAIL